MSRQISFTFTVRKETLLTPKQPGEEYSIVSPDGTQCTGKFTFNGKIDQPAATAWSASATPFAAMVKDEPGLESQTCLQPEFAETPAGAEDADMPVVKDEPMDASGDRINDSGFVDDSVNQEASANVEGHGPNSGMAVKEEPQYTGVEEDAILVLALKDDPTKFACSICGKVFIGRPAALQHYRIQHQPMAFAA